jgi:phage baseplate assembly protein W
VADPATANGDREIVRRRLLGWSVACPRIDPAGDLGCDLVLATDPETGRTDLAQVEKLDALSQSLQLALTTALGSDVFNTDFGFDGLLALAEETSPSIARERVRVSVVQVLRKDPRVVDVHDVDVGDEFVPGSRELNVAVAFRTVTEDDVQANLGRVDGLG